MPTTEPRRLSLLDNLRVASPCSARWEDMKGDERIRFCASCEKHVYNLSAMRADEAEALLGQRDGSVCVRLYRREDGTVLTEDCPVGARKKRVRRVIAAAAGAGALAAGALAVGDWVAQPRVVMGAVPVMSPPAIMGTVAEPVRPPPAPPSVVLPPA
jgi:hypothetical protein